MTTNRETPEMGELIEGDGFLSHCKRCGRSRSRAMVMMCVGIGGHDFVPVPLPTSEGPIFQFQGWRGGEIVALVQGYAGADLHAAAVDAWAKLGDGPFDERVFTIDPERFAMTEAK